MFLGVIIVISAQNERIRFEKPEWNRVNGKAVLLDKKGDKTGAEVAKTLAKKYQEEEKSKK